MRAKEFIYEDLEEGWKDKIAGAALAVGALGGHANVDAKPVQQIDKPAITKQIQAPQKVTPPALKAKAPQEPVDLLSYNQHEEEILHRAAKAAGIKGVELAQFMAQCAHESADFSRMKELGGKKYLQKKYDPKHAPRTAKILGNTKVGDGERYYGRGYIQITGRDNYRMAGQALGLPLEKHPELAAKPEVAAKIAVWYWKTRVKPNVTNFNDTNSVTRYINPAMRGLKDRIASFKEYVRVLG